MTLCSSLHQKYQGDLPLKTFDDNGHFPMLGDICFLAPRETRVKFVFLPLEKLESSLVGVCCVILQVLTDEHAPMYVGLEAK